MKNINSFRVFKRNDVSPNPSGQYVLYWMQTSHRLHYNYALEYAVGWANRLEKPLVILEELTCDYRWACDRIHMFYLQGMREHLIEAEAQRINYLPLVEDQSGQNSRSIQRLISDACLLVSDEYPVFFIRGRNEWLREQGSIPFITVDSNGLIPLQLTDKAPYNAYFFRRIMQQHFVEYYTHPPSRNPLDSLEQKEPLTFSPEIEEAANQSRTRLNDITDFVSNLDIRHDIYPVGDKQGTRQAGLQQLQHFLQYGLPEYGEKRNDPDEKKTSGLSPWLHFGKISTHEIIRAVFELQPPDWDLDDITDNNGSMGGFFNGDANISKFLDELITWREVGFHYAHHEPDYASYESLPDWARETLDAHAGDPREQVYSYEDLEQARTHDELWNAAQRQLREEGIIHNYLRMLWGKKVLEWTPDPQTALRYLIELNNQYALDGRDPNSYSGIFWCFGRFDRAWQERPVFGKIRYMSSESTRRKVKLKEYLRRYGTQKSLL